MSQAVVGFGEIMLRLASPGRERLEQALPGTLDASFGGVFLGPSGGNESVVAVRVDGMEFGAKHAPSGSPVDHFGYYAGMFAVFGGVVEEFG